MKNYKYLTCTVIIKLQQLSKSCSRCRKGRGRQNLHPGDIWRRNRVIFTKIFLKNHLLYSSTINKKVYLYNLCINAENLPTYLP